MSGRWCVPWLGRLSEVPTWVVAARGDASQARREHIWNQGSGSAIPPQRLAEGCAFNPVACLVWIDNNRNRVERLGTWLKEWRVVDTRREKTARSVLDVLRLARLDQELTNPDPNDVLDLLCVSAR